MLAALEHCLELATDRSGCCVMQRCMDYASTAQKDQLVTCILDNFMVLVQNAFGNYVVQYVIDLKVPRYTKRIANNIMGHLAVLSIQKFSSNVVEKCLRQIDHETRGKFVDELTSDSHMIGELLNDSFGNYVIQTALDRTQGPKLAELCSAIQPHLILLKQSPYGKRIYGRILKRIPPAYRKGE